MDELKLKLTDEPTLIGLARKWQRVNAAFEAQRFLGKSGACVYVINSVPEGYSPHREKSSFGRFDLGSDYSVGEQIRGVPNLVSSGPLFKNADMEDERRKSLRMAEHRALLTSKLAEDFRIALEEMRRTFEAQAHPAENESVCLQENYSGFVQEKTDDQVTVTYGMSDGSSLTQTYEVNQFKEGKIPKPGDHLKALVRVEVISPDQEEDDDADFDSDLGKLRALATHVPIEI